MSVSTLQNIINSESNLNSTINLLKQELDRSKCQNEKLMAKLDEQAQQITKLTNTIHELTAQLKTKTSTQNDNYSSDESTISTASTKRRKTTTKNKTPPKNQYQPVKIATYNRFEPLEESSQPTEDMEMSTENLPPTKNDHTTSQKTENTPSSKPSTSKNSYTAQTVPIPPTTNKIPPIIMRCPEKWTTLSKTLKQKSINYLRASTVRDGIRIQPETSDDYRKLTRLLQDTDIEFHTYQLQEEKELKIVIRGLFLKTETEEITEDLKEKGLNPSKVTQMTNKITKQPMPLFLITLPRTDKKIYELTNILGLSIKIENLKATGQLSQCYRCQKYGHTQSFCTAAIKCVKCGQGHRSTDCPLIKEKDTPTCANCGNNHVASYRGCPMAPKPNKPTEPTERKGTTYANIVKATTTKQTTDVNLLINTFQNMLQEMSKIISALPKKQ